MTKPKGNSPFAFNSDTEAKLVLQQEGRKLEKIARSVWQKYLASYTPKAYIRTGRSEQSIKLGKVFRIDANNWGIELTFQNDLAYHNSVFKNGKKGHAVMLISMGWKVKKGKHKDVYRFGYFEGFNYIGKVQEAYKNDKDSRVKLEVQWSGKALK